MCHTRRAIHIRSTILKQSVEVKRSRDIAESVVSIDDDLVSYVCSDLWYRPLSIDADHGTLEFAIGVCSRPADVEVMNDSGSLNK